MDQLTFQTIIEGGILITLVYFGGKLIAVLKDIATSTETIATNTTGGGNGPGPKGGGTGDKTEK